MFQDEEDKHPTQTSVDVKQPPPATFHDWLIANNLDDWPLEIEEDPTEFKFQVSPESLGVGSQEEIQNEIKNKSCIFFIFCPLVLKNVSFSVFQASIVGKIYIFSLQHGFEFTF